MRKIVCLVVFALVFGAVVLQAQPRSQGDEFQANEFTTGDQWFPRTALQADGSYVVVWQDSAAPGDSGSGIRGRRYNADYEALGSEFMVNTYITGTQQFPDVVADANGDFVVVWQNYLSVTLTDIRGQLFSSDGSRLGDEFVVNDITGGAQIPDAARSADGSFLVAWRGTDPVEANLDGDSGGVHGQLFDSAGNRVGAELVVNEYTTGDQTRPVAASDGNGGFLITWEGGGGQDGDGTGIIAKRYDSAGIQVGSEFVVNSYITGDQKRPEAAYQSDGSFVVTWSSNASPGNDISGRSILARRFDSSANPVGDDFQVNSYTSSEQTYVAVNANRDDVFTIFWQSDGSSGTDTSSTSIQSQSYDADGNPLRGQIQRNVYTSIFQGVPAVSDATADGSFLLVWESIGSLGNDGAGFSVQALGMKYRIFNDGFESEDTFLWSDTIPPPPPTE